MNAQIPTVSPAMSQRANLEETKTERAVLPALPAGLLTTVEGRAAELASKASVLPAPALAAGSPTVFAND